MKGYRTILTNAVVLLASLAAGMGFDIPAKEQGELIAGIMAAANIVLRLMTTTPVGKKD